MKTYARIEQDTVVELLLTEGDICAMFHSDLRWIDVTDVAGIVYGSRYDGRRLAPPAHTESETAVQTAAAPVRAASLAGAQHRPDDSGPAPRV